METYLMGNQKKYNAQQAKFINAICEGKTQVEAYREADYKGDPYHEAWRIARRCAEEIEERLNRAINEQENIRKSAMTEARQKQIRLMNHSESEMVQFLATKELLGDPKNINIGGQKNNPVKLILIDASEIMDNKPKEMDDDE